ncbi:MAG: (Fe-S)-binding protein [archaeon]
MIKGIFSRGKTLFYPGCLTKYVLKAETQNYRKILEKIGVDYIMMEDEFCCGSPAINAGYEADTRKLARKNLEKFKEKNIKKIITGCPACYKMLKKEYKELLPDWDIEVEHITTVILEALEKKPRLVARINDDKVTYHDPCHLGRHMGIYDEPREILKMIGYNIVEMANSREFALCCGGGGGLRVNNQELANSIALERIKQAKKTGAIKIITTCPLCFSHIQENSGILVEEFSVTVAEALGLEPEKTTIELKTT